MIKKHFFNPAAALTSITPERRLAKGKNILKSLTADFLIRQLISTDSKI
tara:strand:- start:43 stop:189 length:147 start_codon:yes stop_codon:yes gene_type:complete